MILNISKLVSQVNLVIFRDWFYSFFRAEKKRYAWAAYLTRTTFITFPWKFQNPFSPSTTNGHIPFKEASNIQPIGVHSMAYDLWWPTFSGYATLLVNLLWVRTILQTTTQKPLLPPTFFWRSDQIDCGRTSRATPPKVQFLSSPVLPWFDIHAAWCKLLDTSCVRFNHLAIQTLLGKTVCIPVVDLLDFYIVDFGLKKINTKQHLFI